MSGQSETPLVYDPRASVDLLLADLLAIVNRHQGLNADQAMAEIHAACQAAIDRPIATRHETTPADDAIAALRALLDGEWADYRRIPQLLAQALDIPPTRARLDISRGQIALVITADSPGCEAWDDYAAARVQECGRCIPGADGEPLDVRTLDQRPCEHVQRGSYLAEQTPIVSPPAVREAADQYLPRSTP